MYVQLPAPDAKRRAIPLGTGTGIAGLFLFGLNIPVVSATAMALMAAGTIPHFLLRRPPRARFLVALALLLAALGSYYWTSVHYDFYTPESATGYFAVAVAGYVLGYVHGRGSGGRNIALPGLLAITAGSTLFAGLSVLTAAPFDLARRVAPSAWGGLLINAPGLGALGSVGMAVGAAAPFLAPHSTSERWAYRVLFPCVAALGLYANVALQNRTPFLALAATLVLYLGLFVLSGEGSAQSRAVRFATLMTFVAIAGILLGAYVVSTDVYQRFETEGLASARYELWSTVLTGLPGHPDGGRQIRITENYAHNLWLDVAWDAGVLPFALLVAFHLLHVKPFLSTLRSRLDLSARLPFTGIGVALLFTSFAEPVTSMPIGYLAFTTYYLGTVLGIPELPAALTSRRNTA